MSNRVLITGGAGFIGRHLVRYLLKETDWDITVLDRLGEGALLSQHFVEAAYLEGAFGKRVVFWFHDLKARMYGESSRLHAQAGFRYIIHLAAGSHVDRSIKDPEGFVQDNVLGTCNLLQFARRCEGLEKLLHFSTDEVFGAANGKAFDEFDSFYATNPYSASKAAAEALCPAWANTFGVPIVVTRCTNVCGPGQDGEKFIPTVRRLVAAGSTVQIHSRAGVSSSRKYIDVDDVCAAIVAVIARGGVIAGRNSGYYNISGDVEYSNFDVAARIAEMMRRHLLFELVEDPPNRPRPDQRYDLCNARLKELGWTQRVSLDSTLRRILECI